MPEAGGGSAVEAAGAEGVAVKFAQPTPEGLEPVLYLTRRGDIVVAAVDPKDPFPKYHGQGGRLHRAGRFDAARVAGREARDHARHAVTSSTRARS